MVTKINIIIALLWSLSALVDYADFCHLWQLKEYRWDRFRDFLSTQQGKNFFLKYPLFWRAMIAIIIFFWPINDVPTIKYLLLGIFSLDLLYNSRQFIRHKLRCPVPTKKALLIIFLALTVEGAVFVFIRDWTLPLLFMIMRFVTLAIMVVFVNQLTKVIKQYIIKKATEKMRHYSSLMVIGVTGSYGKTTTKTFLQHILEVKFRSVMTPKNINTEIGVAKFILQTDFSKYDVFIAEMGAYKIGEIKKICDIVKPKIGILTAINEQHLSLFGDIKNIQEAKYELLRALPDDGLAITNADNPLCAEYLDELTCAVETFGADEENKPTFLLKNIKSEERSIICAGEIKGEPYQMSANVPGEHNALNTASCVLTALYLGMSKEQISERVKTLKLPRGLLQFHNYGNCMILDDSYNSNPDGFRAALQILSRFPSDRRRIIITRGILELGEKSAEIHERIGEEISLMAEELIIITKDFAEPLTQGVGKKFKTQVTLLYDHNKLLEYARGLKNSHSIILLENRMPSIVYRELIGKTL